MSNYNATPTTFGAMLARGWELSRRTLPTSGLLFLVIILSMTVLTGFAARTLFVGIMEIVRTQGTEAMSDPQAMEQIMPHMILPLIGSYMGLIVLSLLYQFLLPYASTASIIAGWGAVNDDDPTLGDLLRRAIRRPFWYILVQAILVGVIIGVANLISTLIGILLGVFTAGIGTLLVNLAFTGALIYYLVATAFSKHEIVVHDRGPMKSLLSSIELAKGSWGRTFGMMALMTAATTICLLPVIIPMGIDIIGAISTISSNPNDQSLMVEQLLSAFSPIFSPLTLAYVGIVTAASMHLFTNTLTALYADLQNARKITEENEWGEDIAEAPDL